MSIEKQVTITIDVSNIKTTKELHLLLKKVFELPDFYGENWNAFWDTITGFIELPMKIQFIGWSNLERILPSDAYNLLELFNDFNEEYPDEKREILYH